MAGRKINRLARIAVAAALFSFVPGCTLPPHVVLFGDSITIFYTAWWSHLGCTEVRSESVIGQSVGLPVDPYVPPTLLESAPTVINALDQVPDTVLVSSGLNDLRAGLRPEHVGFLMDLMEGVLHRQGVTTVRWVTLTPVSPAVHTSWAHNHPWIWDTWAEWNRQVLARGGIDASAALGPVLDPDEEIGDGVHPNSQAHRLMGEAVAGVWCTP